jgi:hypothetical protein
MVTIIASQKAAPGSAATIATAWPAAYTPTAGDRAHLFVGGKYGNTASDATINQGFTQAFSGVGGTIVAAANDVGQCKGQLFEKLLVGSDTAPTVTAGGTAYNSWNYIMLITRPTAGKTYRDAIGTAANYESASITGTGSPATGAAAFTGAEVTTGDAILVFHATPTDTGSALTTLSSGIVADSSALTGGTIDDTSTNYIEATLGQDSASVWMTWTGFTGTQTAFGVQSDVSITGSTNHSGVMLHVSVREQASVAAGSPILVMPPRTY